MITALQRDQAEKERGKGEVRTGARMTGGDAKENEHTHTQIIIIKRGAKYTRRLSADISPYYRQTNRHKKRKKGGGGKEKGNKETQEGNRETSHKMITSSTKKRSGKHTDVAERKRGEEKRPT